MTTVKGTLNVDEAVTFDSTLGVTGLITASAGVSVPTGQTFSSDTVNIDGGATDGTTAGNNSPTDGSFTQVTEDNVVVNGSNIGHTNDTDLIAVAADNMTVNGDITIGTSTNTIKLPKTTQNNGGSGFNYTSESIACNARRGQLVIKNNIGDLTNGSSTGVITVANSTIIW